MTILWVERLRLADLALLWPRAALMGGEVRYDELASSLPALLVVRMLQRLKLARNILPAALTLSRRDESGRALNYRREAELDQILDRICVRLPSTHASGKPVITTGAGDGGGSDRPAAFRSVVKSYLSNYLMFRVTFLIMAEAASREYAASRPADEHVFYVTRHPANGPLIEFYAERGLRLRQSPSIRSSLRNVAAPLLTLARVLRTMLFGRKIRTNIARPRPAVWIEYYPDDLNGYVSRAFWRKHAPTDRFDRVFYLDRQDIPCDRQNTELIERHGLRWIDCRQPWKSARLSMKDLRELFAQFFSLDWSLPLWFHLFRFEYELWTRLWTDVFRRFQVKILIQHQEFSWKQAAQARALDAAGGVMVGFHWSDFPFTTEPIHLNVEHLFFLWGRTTYLWLKGKGQHCRRLLPCGVWIVPDDRAADALRARMNGAEFQLAIFDSSCAYNIYFSPKDLSDFMLAVLIELEEHPSWRAVLKPKSRADYRELPQGKRIMEKLESLRRSGQLVVTERLVSPATAARAADLAVCFGLNSAGIVAGAFGTRAIHWDAAGWRDHPLYRDSGQRLLFPDLDAFRKALRAAAAGDKTVGDFSRWRKLVNEFDDREAARRVGEWIRDYMARVAAGTSASQALEEASDAYLSRNRVPEDFYRDEAWWAAPSYTLL